MDDQNKNLILATALSFIVILVWFVLFPPPEPDISQEATSSEDAALVDETATAPNAITESITNQTDSITSTGTGTKANTPRVEIDTPRLSGSISLLGGRIDDLKLNDYRVSLSKNSAIVTLLKPVGSDGAQYALYGWAPSAGVEPESVPGPNTEWQISNGSKLGIDSPVQLEWSNGVGQTFTREIAIDSEYMFTITQSVINDSNVAVGMAPYGLIARHGLPPELKNFFILHEGVVSMADGILSELDWDDIPEYEFDPRQGARSETTSVKQNGWIGFTDHYWMSTLIPQPGSAFRQVIKYDERRDIYQAEAVLPTLTIASGEVVSVTTQLFAGAKEWATIRDYQAAGVEGFIDSIDWGWFFFLTKPIFWLLHELNKLIGNMGWSIIGLTLIIKAILFPLAYKSYVSMAKMKELQPQMEALKEAAGDDRQKMQQGMMGLYKKEKVNPAAGCLPILLQIPIFFSLYKVIFVTIELRHAPFFGPFQDLSAPDPTSLLNLFGLLPVAAPDPGSIMALIFIGILPLLLGISMWVQQKLNPAPTDPTQQMIFAWMPWVFMFMLGGFASGLVVYWIANNTITFTQQYLIMRSQGYKPDLLGNIRSGFKKRTKADKK